MNNWLKFKRYTLLWFSIQEVQTTNPLWYITLLFSSPKNIRVQKITCISTKFITLHSTQIPSPPLPSFIHVYGPYHSQNSNWLSLFLSLSLFKFRGNLSLSLYKNINLCYSLSHTLTPSLSIWLHIRIGWDSQQVRDYTLRSVN